MKHWLQQQYRQHPWQFTSLITILWLVLAILISFLPNVLPALDNTLLRALGQIILAVVFGLLTFMLGWQSVEPNAGKPQSTLPIVIALLIAALPFALGLRIEQAGWFAFIVLMELVVGFSEELVFRGLVLQALLAKGRMLALLVSSLLFGAVHLVNILYGSAVPITLLQVLGASVFGFGLGAVVLRTGALWPAMLIHALANTALRFSWIAPQYLPTPALNAIVSTLLLLYGIVLLIKKSKKQAV
jgi:membrane protease YdiL (CAAX protease family)